MAVSMELSTDVISKSLMEESNSEQDTSNISSSNDIANYKYVMLIPKLNSKMTLTMTISNYKNYKTFLETIGEGAISQNYLLIGPPGVGKTTMVRVMATILKLPIFQIDCSAALSSAKMGDLLNPPLAGPKIILFEDFDR